MGSIPARGATYQTLIMKTELLLCPTTTHPTEAQDYVMLWPHNGTYSILWKMWCSSRRWALQDAAQDFNAVLNEMYPEGWAIHWFQPRSRKEISDRVSTMNLEQTYDWPRLRAARRKYKLPPWSREPDEYQEPTW